MTRWFQAAFSCFHSLQRNKVTKVAEKVFPHGGSWTDPHPSKWSADDLARGTVFREARQRHRVSSAFGAGAEKEGAHCAKHVAVRRLSRNGS